MAEDIKINIEKDLQGEKIISVEKEGYTYPLNSRIDAEGVSELYSKRYGSEKFFNTIILFGFSDGRIIRNFLKNMSEGGGVVVFEPSKDIFETAKKEFDLGDIVLDKRVSIVCGEENLLSIFPSVISSIPTSMVNSLQYAILPNYDVLFTEICRKWQNLVFDEITNSYINQNTMMLFQGQSINNFISNLPVMINSSDITPLIENFRKVDLSEIPAVIVGAGPSLDKNVDCLKGMDRKVFIIATDTAVKTLVKHGIKCHIIINVDPNVRTAFFDDENMKEAGLITVPHADPNIFSKHMNNSFISYSHYISYAKAIFGKTLDHDLIYLESKGSVSCDAYSLVKQMGFKKIIFIGQDLAFTGGKVHTETFNKVYETTDEKYNEGSIIEKVTDWDGNELETDFQMAAYLKWFNKKFEMDTKAGIQIYDATEGGAKKEYAVRITLKEVLDKFAKDEIDFSYMINHTRKTFTRRERAKVFKRIRRLPSRLRVLRNELYRKKEHFLKLSQEYVEKEAEPGYLENLMSDIEDSMHFDKESALFQLLSLENGDAETVMKNVVYNTELPFDRVLKAYSDYYGRYYDSCNSLIKRIEDKQH